MEVILNPPMITQHLAITFGTHHLAANEIARLHRGRRGTDLAFPHAHADHTQTFPFVFAGDSFGVVQNRVVSFLHTAVAAILRAVLVVLDVLEVALQCATYRVPNILQQFRLVLLHRQRKVAAPLDDLARNRFLATHRVNGHDGAMEFEHFQELRNRRDFVGLFRGRHLAQTEMLLGGPGAYQVQGAELRGARASQSLAVDGNVLDVEFSGDGGDPTLKALLKSAGIDAIKEALEGVVGRNAVGELKEATQPIAPLFAEDFDLLPILSASQDGTQGNDDDVGEQMEFAPIDAWIFQVAKMLLDGKGGSQGNSSMKSDVFSFPILGAFT